MNTNENFSRRIVFAISALMIALWLPLTTFAQDKPNEGGFTQSAKTGADNCARSIFWDSDNPDGAEIVGFGETDPADRQSFDAVVFLLTANVRVSETGTGFTETDPARLLFRDAVMIPQASNHRVAHVDAGFSETDPTANMLKSAGEIKNQTFVACHGGNQKEMSLGAPDFSSLTENLIRPK